MSEISKYQILASSSGWIASLLNFFPGVGVGYIYQRRWLPYFLTSGAVAIWFALGIYLQEGKDPSNINQLIGIGGLFLISIITVIESKIAHKRATIALKNLNIEESKSLIKKGWFN